jgi:hypothetical protein
MVVAPFQANCCGLQGYEDYSRIRETIFSVPISCCKVRVAGCGADLSMTDELEKRLFTQVRPFRLVELLIVVLTLAVAGLHSINPEREQSEARPRGLCGDRGRGPSLHGPP